MPLEYYNQNSLRKYPFKDTCSLLSDSGVRLPDDCLVDAQVTAHLPTYYRAYLKSFVSDGTTLTLQVACVSFDGTSEYEVITISQAVSGLVVHDTLTYAGGNVTVRLVVGPGLAATATTPIDWAFTLAAAELAASAMPLFQTRVYSVSTENINTVNNQPVSVTTFDANQALVIKMGTNMVVTGDGSVMSWSVEPGAGTGLFDNCASLTATSPLRRINGVSPDEFGNFKIQSDACYNKSMGAGWLAFSHACGGGCHEPDYKALAYYLNRLRGANNVLSNYAVATKQNYDAAAARTVAKIEAAKKYRPPYIKVETSTVRYMKEDFVSATLGIHLPNKEKIVGSLEVNAGGSMTMIDRSAVLSIDNVAVKQSGSPGFTDMHLNCKKNIYQKFAMKAPKLVDADSELVDVWNLTSDDAGYSVDALLTHDRGVAFTYLPLFKKDNSFSINYNYFYKPVEDSGEYHAAFEFDFFDSENRELNTSFEMPLPNGLTIVQGSLKLWVDETVVTLPGSLQRAPGWTFGDGLLAPATTMHFGKKNRLTFKAVWRGDPCTDTPVSEAAITLLPTFTTLDADGTSHTFAKSFQVSFTEPA